MGRSIAVAAAFLIAHELVPRLLPGAWSLDAGGGVPAGARLVALALAALLVLAAVRGAGALDPWKSAGRRFAAMAVLAAAALAAAVAFPSATPLLGDGQLRLNDLSAAAAPVVAEMPAGDDTAPLAFALVRKVHALLGADGRSAYAAVAAAAGALFAALAFAVSGRLAGSAEGRAAVLVALLASGGVAQFLGYVEVYALLQPGALAFLLAAMADRESAPRPPWRAAAVLAVLGAVHLSALALLPALAWAAAGPAGRGARILRAGGACAAAVGGTAAIAAALGYPFRDTGDLGAKILPLVGGDPGHRHAYAALSPAHLLDVLQEIVLVAPVAVMAAALGRSSAREEAAARPEPGRAPAAARPPDADRLLAVAAVSSGAFLLLANPEIGASRDWDLLAAATLPLTLIGARRLARAGPGRAFWILTAAAAHTMLWVSLNASDVRSDRRFERLLEHTRIAPRGAAYGWETLARWRLDRGHRGDATRAIVRAAEISGDNARLWMNAGSLLRAGGDDEGARRAFERAQAIVPEWAEPAEALAAAAWERGDWEEAAAQWERVTSARPGSAEAWLGLGQARVRAGDAAGARSALQRALELRPDGPFAEGVRRWLDSE